MGIVSEVGSVLQGVFVVVAPVVVVVVAPVVAVVVDNGCVEGAGREILDSIKYYGRKRIIRIG